MNGGDHERHATEITKPRLTERPPPCSFAGHPNPPACDIVVTTIRKPSQRNRALSSGDPRISRRRATSCSITPGDSDYHRRRNGIRGNTLSTITPADLVAALTGDPEALDVHLSIVERDVLIDGFAVKIHCHCLSVDGNGRVQPHLLAQFMRNAVADYAISRSKLAKAKARDAKYNSTEAVTALVEQARRSFTDLAKTGEGGEMLLFLLAERFLKLPQILCKMDLKTDSKMHYHGADGVYAGVTPDGLLKLYWGESKIYKSAASAIQDCLTSLAPFLAEPEHEEAERERDLILLSDKADLSDPRLTDALKSYFDRSSPMSKRVQYCGVALVGFDAAFYPQGDVKAAADDLAKAARLELESWRTKIGGRLAAEKLDQFEIEFFCLPRSPSIRERTKSGRS